MSTAVGSTFLDIDGLVELDQSLSLGQKIAAVHRALEARVSSVDRIAVAVYEPATDLLKTLVATDLDFNPLSHYEARLADCAALVEVLEQGRPRVIQDLTSLQTVTASEHTRRILEAGYRASFTKAMMINNRFFGFVFFDSRTPGAFVPEVLGELDLFAHLVSLIVVNEVAAIRTLLAAIRTARDMTNQRDAETGAHVDRMARYSRLIALELADEHGFDDEYLEHVFMFAPLHDIGKLAVADRILLKPGRLTEEEMRLMKTHVARGQELVDSMLQNFGLDSFQHIEMLRNIVLCHHETLNGTGYPRGLRGSEIPIEARIIAVADIFDAMTSVRPYKEAWTNEAAFSALTRLADAALDKECVEALMRRTDEVEEIQAQFSQGTRAEVE
ncbi:MAG: HD domain-containing protein [Nitrospirae bacterium]|nr:HD domain-containing protein [Nitrospirota bacterium]